MDLLQDLHKEHQNKPETSKLIFWITSLSNIIDDLDSLNKALFSKVMFKKPYTLSIQVTEELKAWSALVVIFSHVSYFLLNDSSFLYPFSNYGGVAVNLFFFLSAYGLALSYTKWQGNLKGYFAPCVPIHILGPLATVVPKQFEQIIAVRVAVADPINRPPFIRRQHQGIHLTSPVGLGT